MNNSIKTLIVGALLAVSAPFALADSISASISANGTDTFTSTTLTLPGSGSSASGTINGYSFTGVNVYFDSNPLNISPPGGTLSSPLLIASLGGNFLGSGLSLYITSETPSYFVVGGTTYLTVQGTGYFSEYGFSDTPASFSITSTYNANATVGTLTSFGASSSTVAPTPEPSSLLLLGSGLVGTAGMLFRRRRAGMAV